jgi:hypothetical protein
MVLGGGEGVRVCVGGQWWGGGLVAPQWPQRGRADQPAFQERGGVPDGHISLRRSRPRSIVTSSSVERSAFLRGWHRLLKTPMKGSSQALVYYLGLWTPRKSQ